MTMPKFEDFLLPTLRIFADGSEHTTEECQEKLAKLFWMERLEGEASQA